MASHPGLNCIPKQPSGQSGHKLPLHVRPTPYSRVEAPLCFKIFLVYLYIRVLSYFKNAFPLCFGSLGQCCSPGCTFQSKIRKKKIHIFLFLYISLLFQENKYLLNWSGKIFWEKCFCTLCVLLLLFLNKCFRWQGFCSEKGLFMLGLRGVLCMRGAIRSFKVGES